MAGNPFAGLVTGKVSGSGTYLSPGFDGDLVIDRLEWKEELNEGGSALIVEMTILSSNSEKDPVGAKRSWFQKKNKSFDGAVLEFLYAVLKCDWKNDEDTANQIRANSPSLMLAGLKGEFVGQRIHCVTRHKLTKENRKDFTQHVWSPAAE